MRLIRLVVGLLATMFILVMVFIPTWIFIFVRNVANPEGFWQNIVLFGLGFWVLGVFQVSLVIGGIFCIVAMWAVIFGDVK